MSQMANKFADFRRGWLATQAQQWRTKRFADPLKPSEVTHEFLAKCLTAAYRETDQLALQPAPQFVVTNFEQADSSKGQLGIAAWACTWVGRRVTDVNEFIHHTCPKQTTQETKASMLRLIQRIDSDWHACPLLILMLRMAMHDVCTSETSAPTVQDVQAYNAMKQQPHVETIMGRARLMNSAGCLGLIEIDTPMLPALQFAKADNTPQMCSMTRHATMHALRVNNSVIDSIHGQVLRGKIDFRVLDVELTVFLLRSKFVAEGRSDEFDEACSDLRNELMLMIRDLWSKTRSAPNQPKQPKQPKQAMS